MASKRTFILRIVLDFICLCLAFLPWIILHSGVKPYQRGFFCNDESIKYPFHPSTISSAINTGVGIALPIIVILVGEGLHYFNKKRKGETIQPHAYNIPIYVVNCYKTIGIFLFGCAAQQTITNIGKYSVGRLRPHFFDVCKPNWTEFSCKDSRDNYVFVEGDFCTGTDQHLLQEMRLSFPSGHASLIAYCMVFLVLYLQARMTWRGSALLKHLLQLVFLWMAVFVCLSRIMDNKHHWSDVLTGAALGAGAAILCGLYISRMFKDREVKYFASVLQEMGMIGRKETMESSFDDNLNRNGNEKRSIATSSTFL